MPALQGDSQSVFSGVVQIIMMMVEQQERAPAVLRIRRVRPALAAPLFLIAMVLACAAIRITALAAIIEADPK
jgi:hypothetical protein